MTGSITSRCVWAGVRALPPPADPTSGIWRDKSSSDLTAPLCPPYAQTRLCVTLQTVSVTVCPLALRSPRISVCVCVLRASACTPSLRMKHSFFFLQNFSLCVHTPGEDVRAKRICGVSIARFNACTKASSVASAWCRRAAACGEPPHCCASCSPDSS